MAATPRSWRQDSAGATLSSARASRWNPRMSSLFAASSPTPNPGDCPASLLIDPPFIGCAIADTRAARSMMSFELVRSLYAV